MKIKIKIKQSNPDFNKEYATQYHEGKESVDNWKENWGKEFLLEGDLDEILLQQNINYNCNIEFENGEKINTTLPNMTILKCLQNNQLIYEVIISSKLIKTIKQFPLDLKSNLKNIHFDFKTEMEYYKIDFLFYVLKEDTPKELELILLN